MISTSLDELGSGGVGGIGAATGNTSVPLSSVAGAMAFSGSGAPTALSGIVGATAISGNPSLTNTASSSTAPVLLPNFNNLPAVTETLNFQVAAEGFGSYLFDILPDDDAKAAGAFSASMQQINNILNVDFEKFAQVASSIEIVNKGLPSINGTDVPVDTTLATSGFAKTALGSGPNGTYTASDFFGAMSGLPYMWKAIQSGITDLQTTTLSNIYKQLYLAVTWEQASNGNFIVQYTSYQVQTDPGPPPAYTTYYHVTGITVSSPQGGGYCRENANPPTITLSNGATGTAIVGTNPSDLTTFGRIIGVTLTGSGTDQTSVPTVNTIPEPPTTYGSSGWPGMTVAVQYYIDAANTEIRRISAANPTKARNLNMAYDATGTQLTIEQRARYTAIPPVPTDTRDVWLNLYPMSLMIFADAVSELSKNTLPHMSAQTLEMISDLGTTGGQSLVGLMRQERNAARLQEIGIQLDNMIPGELSDEQQKILIANGTINLGNPGINGYTIPAIAQNDTLIPSPAGFYSTTPPSILVSPGTVSGTSPSALSPNALSPNALSPNALSPNALSPSGLPTTAPVPAISYLQGGFVKTTAVAPGDPAILLTLPPGDNIPVTTIPGVNSPIATVGTLVPAGQGAPLDVGQAPAGSLAPSKAINLLPPTLSVPLTASTLAPASFSVPEAIDEVIKCNCDCWVH
jgi:hypothetical protein